jgi:hypothetical protein
MYTCWIGVASKVVVKLAKAQKQYKAHDARNERIAHATQVKGTMKWLPFQSTSLLEKMCVFIKNDVRTNSGLGPSYGYFEGSI